MSRIGSSLEEFGFIGFGKKFSPEQEEELFGWQKRIQEQRSTVDGFAPTIGMKEEAQRGLDWRREFGRGGTAVGIARARDIVNGKRLPIATVKRMHSFFSRHAVDKKGLGFSQGEDGYPSNGRIAWALWGGDAGKVFAASIVAREAGKQKGRK